VRRVIAAALAGLVLASCSSPSNDSPEPTFGGSSATTPNVAELAEAKAAAGIQDCPQTKTSEPNDKDLSGLVLDCLGGGHPVELAGLRAKPTVINLWASWCGPCKEELPFLAKAHRELGDRVQILGIDFADDSPGAAIDLAKSAGVTYPLLADPKSSSKGTLKVVGLPQTVFVDAQGTIVATERRAYRSYDDLTNAISKHLGVNPRLNRPCLPGCCPSPNCWRASSPST
jgi:cytochrome c biogenesis protein CcmG, thiol:disulfide interchange protein DsbE